MTNATTRLVLAAAALGLLVGAAGRAEAGLLLDSIHATRNYPSLATVVNDLGTQAVNPTAHFSFAGVSLEVADSTVTLSESSFATTFSPAAFNGFVFTDVTKDPGITGVTIDAATNLPGFDASRVSFNSDQVFVNLRGLGFFHGQEVKLDLAFGPAVAAVPEPSTLVGGTLGVALALGYAWRRHRRARAAA